MKVFVTGGNGFIGRRLVTLLVAQGYSVSVLTRNPKADFPTQIELVVGDLSANGGLDHTVLSAFDVIFHCAGELKNTTLMRELHVDGTHRLLKSACQAAKDRGKSLHWVQLSSVGAYGPPPQGRANSVRVLTEGTPEAPIGEYEVTKTESDRLVVQASKSNVLTYSILRPSNVIGTEMPNQSLRSLIEAVKRRMFFYIGQPGAIATYVHVDDVAEALLKCGIDARAQGQVFNLSSDCPLEELIRGIATAAGVRSPCIRMPESFVRAVVWAFAGVLSLPLSQERINALVSRTKYPTNKIEHNLDFKSFRYVPDAIRELVTECH